MIYNPGSDHQIFTGDASELDSLVGRTTSDVMLTECYGEDPDQSETEGSAAVATFDAVSGDSVDMTFQSGLEGTVSFSLCNQIYPVGDL